MKIRNPTIQPKSQNKKYVTIETGIKQNVNTKKYIVCHEIGKDKSGKRIRKFESFSRLSEARKALEKFKHQKALK